MIDILISLQGTILIYMFFGFILKKNHMINEQASMFLSRFVLEFVLPINIFNSCIQSFTLDTLKSCIFVLLIAIVIEFVLYGFTKFNLLKVTEKQIKVIRYGLLVSNGGLIGTPVIEGLYGASGVVYTNVFLVPMRILAYVAGEGIFDPNSKKKTLKQVVINTITNKVVLALVFGIILAAFNLQLPGFVKNAIGGVAKCMSPLSLILVGSILADEVKFKFSEDIKIIGLSLIRQILIPIVLLVCLRLIDIEPMVKSIMVLLVGMPIASTTAIYANKYHNEAGFASKAVFISTITSTFTLIFVMFLIELFLI